MLTSKKTARLIAAFASDKKAEDIIVLDMRKVVNFCDYFVICSGTSDRQVRAIADGIDEGLTGLGVDIDYSHKMKKSDWIVLDTGDVIAHVFHKDSREFYQLEYLWQDAKEVKWEDAS